MYIEFNNNDIIYWNSLFFVYYIGIVCYFPLNRRWMVYTPLPTT